MARNKLAGKHKSYDDRGMTEKAILNKRKADKEINERPEQIKKRVEANKARRNAKKRGVNVTGKDASHTKNGIVFKKTSVNRGSKSDSQGDKNARG